MKKVAGSTCKDPQNRSGKKCCCGGHSRKAKKPKYKDHSREKPTAAVDNLEEELCPLCIEGDGEGLNTPKDVSPLCFHAHHEMKKPWELT